MIYYKEKLLNKKIIILLIFFAFLNTVEATTQAYMDSVQKVLISTANNAEKLNCLYILSFEYGLSNPQKGMDYGRQCLKLAGQENNLQYQLYAYIGIANAWETLANYDSALFYHSMSYLIAQKMSPPPKMAFILINIGLCYKQLGYYKLALNNYLTAYRLIEHDSTYNPRIHFYLGEIYIRMENFKEAENHSRLGISKCMEFNHESIGYNMYINLAKCLIYRNQSDSALKILNHALYGLKKNIDEWSIGICYNALAQAYKKKKEFKKAFENYTQELFQHQKTKNESGMLLAYVNLAYSSAQIIPVDKPLVRKYLQQFEEMLLRIKQNKDILLEAFQKAGEMFEVMDNPKKATEYYKRYYSLHDSLLDKEKYLELQEMQIKYETEKMEQKIKSFEQKSLISMLTLKVQAEEIKKRNILIILSLLLFITVGLLLYLNLHKQKLKAAFEKKLAIKATEERERLRISKDIHDDLGSGLSKINFLSEMIIREKSSGDHTSEYVGSIAETSKELIFNMRDMIWALTPENITLSGLVARIREYSTDYLEDLSIELYIKVNNEIPDFFITQESHREILMVIKESLNNIVKHSFASRVEIELNICNNQITVKINDDGIGTSSENLLGNGIKNMKSRIQSIGGQFQLNAGSPKGTSVEISVPVENIVIK